MKKLIYFLMVINILLNLYTIYQLVRTNPYDVNKDGIVNS